nr:PREDICTED: Golgi integral membrane protein 4-like [Latimeria chalumnae]|eukprot:XP_014346170.1 PREDICTED: Golgi integral membrane protein 4-like [Latimeria chalumnae]
MNKYSALSSQHKILKNQHEDLRKQLQDLHLQHSTLKLEHRKTQENHSQRIGQIQREKDIEVSNLQDTVLRLREESKLLRKAHQDVHSQLLRAQAQAEEFRQLKEALQKVPSFKESAGQERQAVKGQPAGPDENNVQITAQKIFPANGANMVLGPGGQQKQHVGGALGTGDLVLKAPGGGSQPLAQAALAETEQKMPANALFRQEAKRQDVNIQPGPAAWGQRDTINGDTHIARFIRTVNSLQTENTAKNSATNEEEKGPEQMGRGAAEGQTTSQKHTALTINQGKAVDHATGNQEGKVPSWEEINSKMNARVVSTDNRLSKTQEGQFMDLSRRQESKPRSLALPEKELGRNHWEGHLEDDDKGLLDKEELEMDAGMIDREGKPSPRKGRIAQEPLIPGEEADPAQDPNNQGEDEFEEAELERPDFEERAAGPNGNQEANRFKKEAKGNLKDAGVSEKMGEDFVDEYQEDQEQENEDNGGEVDDNEDLELVQDEAQKVRADFAGEEGDKEDDY